MGTPMGPHEDEPMDLTPLRPRAKQFARTPLTPANSAGEQICSICLEGLKNTSASPLHVEKEVTRIPCGHLFHLKCLQECRASFNDHCPLCRSQLPAGLTP